MHTIRRWIGSAYVSRDTLFCPLDSLVERSNTSLKGTISNCSPIHTHMYARDVCAKYAAMRVRYAHACNWRAMRACDARVRCARACNARLRACNARTRSRCTSTQIHKLCTYICFLDMSYPMELASINVYGHLCYTISFHKRLKNKCLYTGMECIFIARTCRWI
jgi:hypothetical protein